jgi:quinolinate synthase
MERSSPSQIIEDIYRLKREKNALVLAHFYEDGAIQDLADFTGDSLALAQKGQESKAPIVLLAGVVFMAESVKLLSPEKIVLAPDMNAGCSLVEHSPYDKYLAWRQAHPKALAVTYVNSSAEVKSISDVVCTSSNAEKIIASIPKDREILFGPDRNLGRWLAHKAGRKMELWPGACEVHILFSARKLFDLKAKHPNALVIAHPECTDGVLEYADIIGSTSRLLDEVKNNRAVTEFIVATEYGILHQMQKSRPDALLIQAPSEGTCACNECPYMKMNTLEKIRHSLETLTPQIFIDPKVTAKARLSLERMMTITRGDKVDWPSEFQA